MPAEAVHHGQWQKINSDKFFGIRLGKIEDKTHHELLQNAHFIPLANASLQIRSEVSSDLITAIKEEKATCNEPSRLDKLEATLDHLVNLLTHSNQPPTTPSTNKVDGQ